MKRLSNRSGQALLIAILVGVVLVLSVPIVIFVNQINSTHQATTERRNKGLVVAKEALAYAKQILSTNWNSAVAGNFIPVPDCTSGAVFSGVDGSHFKITCDKNGAQDYQVRIVGTALGSVSGSPGELPIRTLEAYVSQQTLGVNLPEDVHASLALSMQSAPPTPPASSIYNGNITVHWGPLACFDQANPLDIKAATAMDTGRFPRKFINNNLVYLNTARDPGTPPVSVSSTHPTDLREFWAYQNLGFAHPIDDTVTSGYLADANTEPLMPAPLPTNCIGPCTTPIAQTYGHYTPDPINGDVMKIDATFVAGLPPGATVYVTGSAELDAGWDNGVLIVTHDLSLNTPGPAFTAPLRIPPTADLEYPYLPKTAWPCGTLWTPNGATCTGTGFQFRGLIWAKNNLNVQGNWTTVGVVIVGDPSVSAATGQLQVGNTASLTVYYDDRVNRRIRVVPTGLQLQTDQIRELPPS